MKATIQRLTEHLIDQARAIADDAERLGDAGGIAIAEVVIALRDAQRCMRRATDAMRLAVAQQESITPDDVPLFPELRTWTP